MLAPWRACCGRPPLKPASSCLQTDAAPLQCAAAPAAPAAHLGSGYSAAALVASMGAPKHPGVQQTTWVTTGGGLGPGLQAEKVSGMLQGAMDSMSGTARWAHPLTCLSAHCWQQWRRRAAGPPAASGTPAARIPRRIRSPCARCWSGFRGEAAESVPGQMLLSVKAECLTKHFVWNRCTVNQILMNAVDSHIKHVHQACEVACTG